MASKKSKVAVLYEIWEKGNSGEPEQPVPRPKSLKRGGGKKRARPKLDREQIAEALSDVGHDPFFFVLDGRDSLRELAGLACDLVFNLTEAFEGDDTKDANIAAYLDLFGKPYTGAGSHGLYLAQDKALSKKIFGFHDIRSPFFAVSYRGKLDHADDIAFPLIVKPSSSDASIGIDAGSVVHTVKELMERIAFIQEKLSSPALIEEYIEGREIYAAVLGNDAPEALPLVELDLSKLPEDVPKIATLDVKWEKETDAYRKTKSIVAQDLEEEVAERAKQTALAVYEVLQLRDYGRVDMRVKADGSVYVIEANPNPWLAQEAEVAMAAKSTGRSYSDLIGTIVDLAMARS